MNDKLEFLLREVKKYVTPEKEPTIFAIGGRGYYENPASDLLKFFLKPDAEHGLKDLFLSTFFECLGEDYSALSMSYVDIQREVPTDNQNRIDLQILGSDWCLLIENKIYHWQANPFSDYEAHVGELREKKYFSILSPDGRSEAEGWKGISYKVYCQALQEKMRSPSFDPALSKWNLFAREFVLHMENELYNPPMTPEQATLVEKYAAEFMDVQKLLGQYPDYLCLVVKEMVEKQLSYEVKVSANWAILIESPER